MKEAALKQTEIDAPVKISENGTCENGEIDMADEKSQDLESGSISLNLGTY